MPQLPRSLPLLGAGTCLSLLGCVALSALAAYRGACAAGSGPGGWGIHLVFVLPIVSLIGLTFTLVGGLAGAVLPLPLWLRGTLAVGIAVFGSYFAALGLFGRLNAPRPLQPAKPEHIQVGSNDFNRNTAAHAQAMLTGVCSVEGPNR